MTPGKIGMDVIGQMEGFTHQASLIRLSPLLAVNEKKEAILDYLAAQKDILAGVTTAPVNGLIVRMLGNGGEQLFECVKQMAEIINSTKSKAHTIQ